jgi:hypothetical protein
MNKEKLEVAVHFLGSIGKMISHSKSRYYENNPDNLVVFNANVCAGADKIWWGDLDITLSSENLSSLALALNEEISVLPESYGRFENEDSPLIQFYVVKYLPDGTILKSSFAQDYDL